MRVGKEKGGGWARRKGAGELRRHTKSKARRGIRTRVIHYRDRRNPPARPQKLKVDMRRDEHLDHERAAAMVAARMGASLSEVMIIDITD